MCKCKVPHSRLPLLNLTSFLPAVAKITYLVRVKLSNQFNISTNLWSTVAQDASRIFGCYDTVETNALLPNNDALNISMSYLWHRL